MGAKFAFVLSLMVVATPLIAMPDAHAEDWANRLTWGVSAVNPRGPQPGSDAWLDSQLNHPDDRLPPRIAEQIANMRISHEPMSKLVIDANSALRNEIALAVPTRTEAARKAYGRDMVDLSNEAMTRSLLRDIYAPDQLREQLTWFWFNHFNVFAPKKDIRFMVGDYEDCLRTHSLGKFRDLLEATVKHPAMLRYLDNDQNAANHINENYAREIMELHSMGVGSGYTQKDVQELARILTGVGVNVEDANPKQSPQYQSQYIRSGLFEFNPARHDFGEKHFLGRTIKGSGFGEVEEALDLIANSPSTARYVSRQLATYFMGDNPPPALINKMTAAWQSSGGEISVVLRSMIQAPEFRQSLGGAFKDPTHFALSAVRLMYGDQIIVNAQPIVKWLNRMGQGLYGRLTPDGYPLESAAWIGPGQLTARFEIARSIGTGKSGLFSAPGAPEMMDMPSVRSVGGVKLATTTPEAKKNARGSFASRVTLDPLVHLQGAAYYQDIRSSLALRTGSALAEAKSPEEWNALFLSSPEFMRR